MFKIRAGKTELVRNIIIRPRKFKVSIRMHFNFQEIEPNRDCLKGTYTTSLHVW